MWAEYTTTAEIELNTAMDSSADMVLSSCELEVTCTWLIFLRSFDILHVRYTVSFSCIVSSGNHTPGSRFYSEILDTSLHPPARTQTSFKALGCSCNCRRLAYGSFQLTHMSRDDHAVELIKSWRPRRRQNIITALTKLPQGWVSARKHQCTTAITTMWTKSSWAFPESYTADDRSCAQAMGGTGGQKGS